MKKKKASNLTGGDFSLLMKNLRDIFKGRRRVWLGISFLFLIGLFVVFVNKSYALWSASVEKPGQMKIVAGTLQYRLDSVKLTNNKLTLTPGIAIDFTIDIVSLNAVSSKYVLYYEGTLPSGVKIGYVDTPSEGTIGTTNSKQTVTLRVINDSTSNATLTLGVQGGLPNNSVTLISGRTKIPQNSSTLEWKYAYTGAPQEFVAPYSGYYQAELWGAQGGDEVGGKGAYTSGYISLNKGERIYVYVGQHGLDGTKGIDASQTLGQGAQPTFNGGGAGGMAGGGTTYGFSTYRGGAAGGGATDIRLSPGVWFDALGLKNRIMVAGGGGGSAIGPAFDNHFGTSGLVGDSGFLQYELNDYPTLNPSAINSRGKGATQTTGASFGIGAIGANSGEPLFCHGNGGGGGGYYGGYGANHTQYNCFIIGGGGGSSFISGFGGSNAITSSSSLTPTNNPLHYSNKYFVNAELTEGSNPGNGKANITYVGETYAKKNTKLNGVRYIKDCTNGNTANVANHWYEIQAVKDGRNIALNKTTSGTSGESSTTNAIYRYMVDGRIDNGLYSSSVSNGLQCFTVDLGGTYDLDEVAVWHYFGDGRSYNNHTLSVGPTNQSGTTSLANVLISNRSGTKETSNGIHFSAWQ